MTERPNLTHISTFTSALQTCIVSVVSTAACLVMAALPSSVVSASRSLLLAAVPFAGLVRPLLQPPQTRASLALLMQSLRHGPVFYLLSIVVIELKQSVVTDSTGLLLVVCSMNATVASVAACSLAVGQRKTFAALITSGIVLVFGAGVHACYPFSDPNPRPMSQASDLQGVAALLLRCASFNVVHGTTVLTSFATHRCAPRDAVTTQALALASAAYLLLVPWQACFPLSLAHIGLVARRVHAIGPGYTPTPVNYDDEQDAMLPRQPKTSPPPTIVLAPNLPLCENTGVKQLPTKMFLELNSVLKNHWKPLK